MTSLLLCVQVLVDKSTGKVLGLHFTGPNAGEVMQGYAVALRYCSLGFIISAKCERSEH